MINILYEVSMIYLCRISQHLVRVLQQ